MNLYHICSSRICNGKKVQNNAIQHGYHSVMKCFFEKHEKAYICSISFYNFHLK
eukprot:UN09458